MRIISQRRVYNCVESANYLSKFRAAKLINSADMLSSSTYFVATLIFSRIFGKFLSRHNEVSKDYFTSDWSYQHH